MLSILGGYAEFERAISKERQMEGIELAKKGGAYRGRKKALSGPDVTELIRRVDAGDKKINIAYDLGISRETLYKYYSNSISNNVQTNAQSLLMKSTFYSS